MISTSTSAMDGLFMPFLSDDMDKCATERAIAAYCNDLEWTFSPSSVAIVEQIAHAYDVFPELELTHDRQTFAEAVAATVGKPSLHHSLLGHTIDPTDPAIIGHLLSELGYDDELLRYLLPQYISALNTDQGDSGVSRGSVARLLRKLARDRDKLPPDALAAATQVIQDERSLANLALGESLLSTTVVKPILADIDPLDFLLHARNSRNAIMRRLHRNGPIGWETPVPKELSLLIQTVGKLAGLGQHLAPPRREDARIIGRATNAIASGEISWMAFQLELGPTIIGPHFFSAPYAERGPDGTLYADAHPHETFMFGPYASLAAGVYQVEFLGEMALDMAVQFAITSDYGTVRYAFEEQVGPSESGILVSLSFELNEPTETAEFIIRARLSTGLIRSRGVRLTWTPMKPR